MTGCKSSVPLLDATPSPSILPPPLPSLALPSPLFTPHPLAFSDFLPHFLHPIPPLSSSPTAVLFSLFLLLFLLPAVDIK